MINHQNVLIIGAGTAGIMAAAQLKKLNSKLSISIIDPSETHYYQPAWTLVGAGTYDYHKTARKMSSLIPKGVNWIKKYAAAFLPDQNMVQTKDGSEYSYDYLIVCPGLTIDLTMIKGLKESLNNGSVCSIYTDPEYAFELIKNFKGGTALFTQPTTPIKCGGAPQKFMYLSDDYFRKSGVRNKSTVVFATPGTVIFGVKPIKKTLMEVVNRKDLMLSFGYKLVEIDGDNKIAWYEMASHESYHNEKDIALIRENGRVGIKYDLLHLAPPQRSPKFVADSSLSTDQGWLSVDKHSLQHTEYNNIFGLGDVCQLPTAKTGAAIRKQVPIVVESINRLLNSKDISDKLYNGYSSCPLVTGYRKMVLAEFDYDKNFIPDPKLKQMLVFNSDKEHWRLWMLKKYMLPYLYWNKMMKGVDV